MIKFDKNVIKQAALLFVFCIFLFFINYKNYNLKKIKTINAVNQNNFINDKNVNPKELFIHSWHIIKTNYYDKSMNNQNWSKWKKRYKDQIKTNEDAYVAINSMLMSLDDPYSKFMNEKEFIFQNNAINSKLYGIGINISSISGKIYIINVLEGTPAQSANLKSGDIILKINNKDIKGESIYKVIQLIKGDLGENINFEILRGNEKFEKNIKRQEINIKTIEAKKLTDDIGYIRISSFIGADCPKEFVIALNRLKDTKGLIIDLRGNSGGLFQNAIVIANLFLKKGEIVNVIARGGKKNTYTASNEGFIYNNPIVILADENSASASEILASALHDNNRAYIVGTETYGKGLVQKIYPLPNKTGMNLTIAKYMTPLKKDINKKGIKPDYNVNITRNDFINNTDPQLNKAKNILEKEINK